MNSIPQKVCHDKKGQLSFTPAVPSELYTYRPRPGRSDEPSPTQWSRRSSVSPQGQRDPRCAAPGPSAGLHQRPHAVLPSPAPDAHKSKPSSLGKRSHHFDIRRSIKWFIQLTNINLTEHHLGCLFLGMIWQQSFNLKKKKKRETSNILCTGLWYENIDIL